MAQASRRQCRCRDLLFTYETDKATFDEIARDAGTLLAIFAAEGDDVPCLQNVCVIGSRAKATLSSIHVVVLCRQRKRWRLSGSRCPLAAAPADAVRASL
jgi:pyruvate dehydrogenase E2 component (dihydrolipoamide acetyltransferase)